MGTLSQREIEDINRANIPNLKRMFKNAWKNKETDKIITIVERLHVLGETTPKFSIGHAHALMVSGEFETAKNILMECDSNSAYKFVALFQIAFEENNWGLAAKNLQSLRPTTPYPNFLTAYQMYTSRKLNEQFPSIAPMKPTNSTEEYLVKQIENFNIIDTLKFMKSKIETYPEAFDFGSIDLEDFLTEASTQLEDIPREIQVDGYTLKPIFFDRYPIDTDDRCIEISTIPFTNNIYGIKPIDKADTTRHVYSLEKRT